MSLDPDVDYYWRVLAENRLAGTDQNPKGFRDGLYSKLSELGRLRRRVAQLEADSPRPPAEILELVPLSSWQPLSSGVDRLLPQCSHNPGWGSGGWAQGHRAVKLKKRGLDPHCCARPARYKVDGEPLCSIHAGAAALEAWGRKLEETRDD